MTGDGRTVCTGVLWNDVVLAAASTAMLVIAVALCVRLHKALLDGRYSSTLPAASALSPTLALGFGCLYLMGA